MLRIAAINLTNDLSSILYNSKCNLRYRGIQCFLQTSLLANSLSLFSLGKPRPLGGVRVLWLCQKNVLEIAEISLLKFPYLKQKPYWGNRFWAPGYCVDTVGLDAEMVRKYVKYQEDKERREDQLKFKF